MGSGSLFSDDASYTYLELTVERSSPSSSPASRNLIYHSTRIIAPGETLSSMKFTRVVGWEDEECDDSITPDEFGEYECRQRREHVWSVIVALLLGGLVTTLLSLEAALPQPLTAASNLSSCRDPVVRREWRGLSRDEKIDYIKATLCLQQKPSRLGLDHSLYFDFAYVHFYAGNSCMYSISLRPQKKQGEKERKENEKDIAEDHLAHLTGEFLAWHRYLLHAYESALRDECGLKGHLPYV